MRTLKIAITTLITVLLVTACNSNPKAPLAIVLDHTKGAIPLVTNQAATPILIDNNDAAVVSIVANALASDISLITGKKPDVVNNKKAIGKYAIIAGTIGQSKHIDALIAKGKLDVSKITGKWECYTITTINTPLDGIDKALVIVGSDRRGTAYGLFEISKRAGVSPWVFWADVHPEKRETLYITEGTYVSKEPSVKYRGIFINDEDWGLNVWASKNIDTDVKDIGPKTYALVYELLLRLRANFIWPAMHDSTKAFFYYNENPVVADKYAIVMGSTHCDQMLRSNTFEWQKQFVHEYGITPGPYRYDINKKQVYRYWNDRVNETKNFESLYTIGMRGVRDGGIQGPKTKEDKMALMDTIIEDQRGIFHTYFGKADGVPQLFCPYKEVLDLYNKGLQIPDDVTLVWTDDNYGYLRRLSNAQEQKRSGSSGIYYHLSYLGKPHDYLWLSTISPALISYEMTKAFQFGADRLWVVNVGDIKPAELETQFFLDMAWDASKWEPESALLYLNHWAAQTFGPDLAADIAQIKRLYYNLAQTGKPEHLGIIRYDKQTRNERLIASAELIKQVDKVKTKIPNRLANAYFELIEYPSKAMALMNNKIFYARMSFEVLESDSKQATLYSEYARDAYYSIKQLTDYYNLILERGKWNGIITDSPRGLAVYGMPDVADRGVVKDQSLFSKKHKTTYIHRGEAFVLDFSKGEHSLTADKYSSKHDLKSDRIITIKGLGLQGQSISRYPFYNLSYPKENYKAAPSASYKVSVEKGEYNFTIKCLPTRTTHKGRGLQLAIEINGGDPHFIDVNHDRKDKLWMTNVLRGFMTNHFTAIIDAAGEVELKVYFMDTGLALSRIDINKSDN